MQPPPFPVDFQSSEMSLPWVDTLLDDISENSTVSSQQSPVLSPMDTGLWDTIPQQPLLMPQAKQQCAHDAGELEALINRILVDVTLKASGRERLPERYDIPTRSSGRRRCRPRRNNAARQKQNACYGKCSANPRGTAKHLEHDEGRHPRLADHSFIEGKTAPPSHATAKAFRSPQASVTSLMMRNIPNRYTQGELIQEISSSGFAGKFDFFYLPIDRASMANAGYCFINFTDVQDANCFSNFYAGRVLGNFGSRKVVEIVPAAIQGFYENLSHYSKKVVSTENNPELRPIFLVNGRPVKFARATVPWQSQFENQSHVQTLAPREHAVFTPPSAYSTLHTFRQ